METLWFVVPAHGRVDLARVCLRQLRRTCDALEEYGIEASAVVIADDANLETAQELGFATVERDNRWLSRKFNDGIQLATDPRYNPRPADYVVPCGSDDWVAPEALSSLPDRPDEALGFSRCAFVCEDGTKLIEANVSYRGGIGVRVYRRDSLEAVGFRPADEDRARGCDTSILVNVQKHNPRLKWYDRFVHPCQVVDFKSPGEQLNDWDAVSVWGIAEPRDPWETLLELYPDESVFAMRELYAARVPA